MCGEILSWIFEIWMKIHLVSDNTCNTKMCYYPKRVQGMTNIVRLTSSIGDTTPQFTSVLCKTIGIGDTKYHM